MSRKQKDKPPDKSRQRKQKSQTPGDSDDRAQARMPDREIEDRTGAAVAAEFVEAAPAEPLAREASAGTDLIVANEIAATNVYSNAPAPGGLIGIQTIANAYAGFLIRSFQQTGFFVERLMGVRSVDKAVKVQTEFVSQACANLAAESQNFLELYGRLARQVFWSWQALAHGARSSHGAR